MRADFTVINPEKIEMELTITMSLGQWIKLQDELPDEWPACDLNSKIDDMIRQAEAHFYPKQEEE